MAAEPPWTLPAGSALYPQELLSRRIMQMNDLQNKIQPEQTCSFKDTRTSGQGCSQVS
jgi:hypothetical protein